ncbi:beta strand repeat-containing protein [Limnohabitans radicicola]|uniref:Uncharacterized protein n=1 Tax=Limnohabitans radicicola TaxID=2771427 RepID=A0A927IL07_9BURK|nr:hypothetical protein [Limnohabitans radicicola]MBD8049701.1 hypothetical protein [Limnohabitans radicicola]
MDTIDGGTGTADVLNISDVGDNSGTTGLPTGLTIKNIETINFAAAAGATIDTTATGVTVTGLNNLNVTQGTSATVTTGATTAVAVAVAGAATVTGGSTQTVTAVGGVTLSKAAGAITATDTKQGVNNHAIDGGTSVTDTVTVALATGTANGTASKITVGGTTAPTGAVSITQNTTGDTAGNTKGGAVAITGGTTVTTTSNVASKIAAADGSTNYTVTQSAVSVTGGTATTAVTVNQAAAVTAATTKVAVAGSTETDAVQFGVLKSGDTLAVAGVTLTAAADMTAKQVAAAFANLASGQLTGWTSGAVSGTGSDTVLFTSTTANSNVTDLSITLTNTSNASVAPTETITQGVTTVKAAGAIGVASGAVTIADPNQGTTAANTIATVTLSNYGATTIASDALTTLSLTNTSAASATGTVGITNAKATTLDLTVNGGTKGLGAVTAGSTYTALNVHTASTDTAVAITAGGVTALKVDGTNALDLSSSSFGALKTVTVSGAAAVKGDFSGSTVTGVDASSSTGNNTVIVDSTKATFTGGSGNDVVTIAAVPTKAIAGGAGTDTLVLNVAASTFSNPSANTFITGFETLGLGASATGSYDATGFTALTQGSVTGAVTYTNVAAGAGLTITASPGQATTYTLKDASGTSDSLALTLKASAAGVAAGSITAAGIESISINATDSSATAKAGATADSLTLVATSAATVTVTGNTTLTLTSDSTNAKLATVDASGMTGGLSYTAVGALAQTVKGGASANTLAAHSSSTLADTLIGGAGNDQITANAGLNTLTGNGGNDTFVVQLPGASLNVYSTITDANAGDTLQLKDKGAETFTATKVTLAATAVFQDYANAVVNAGGNASSNGAIGWFQYNGDTYVVQSMHNATTAPNFSNGTDLVVKLTGLVDLSTATLANIGGAAPLLLIH